MNLAVEALLRRPEAKSSWDGFRDLSIGDKRTVLEDLKREIDNLVNRDPRLALPIAQTLAKAGEAVPDLFGATVEALAGVYFHLGEYQAAAEEYTRARDLHQAVGKELQAARTQRALVLVYQKLGRYDEAFACERKAREVFERLGEDELLAQLDVHLGNLYVRQDEYPRARDCYRSARVAFEELGSESSLAIVDFNVAVVEQNANFLDEAQTAFERARRTFEKADAEVNIARCDYSLAYLESRRGRFREAIEGLERARERFQAKSDPAWRSLCDLDLAEIHLRLDARRDARDYAQRAADSFSELGMEYELARCESFLATAYARLGETKEARTHFRRAHRRFHELGNEVHAAALEIQICTLEAASGRTEGLASRLLDARAKLDARELALLSEFATLALARTWVATGECDRAIAELQPLTGVHRERGVPDMLVNAEALHVLAAAREGAGDIDGALRDLRRAVRAIEHTYSRVPGSDIRMAFFRDRHEAFTDLAYLLAEAEHPAAAREALEVLEESRSRSLREESVVPDQEGEEFHHLREKLDWLLARRLDADFGMAPEGEEEEAHQLRRMPPSDQEILETQKRLARLSRAGRSERVEAGSRFDPSDLQAARGAGDDVLVAYLTSRRGMRAFTVDETGVQSHAVDMDEARLARLRDRLFLHMDKLRLGPAYIERRGAQLQRSVDAILEELGERLLAPLVEGREGRPLVVIPYGPLHDLPFHAFRVHGEPLAFRHETSYGLSASMVARCRERGAHGTRALPVLATGVDGARLVETRGEMDLLQELYGDACSVLGSEELVSRLHDEPPRGGLVHIASHGQYESENPVFSSLCLGDRFLLAHDILRMRLEVDLVTLSGCETGRRRRIAGDELFGLPRALVGAGVRSILGSLWAVDDQDAAQFMRRFYRALSRGETARRALVQAQRDLAEQRPHPFSWAPFVLIGDPDVRLPSGGRPQPARVP